MEVGLGFQPLTLDSSRSDSSSDSEDEYEESMRDLDDTMFLILILAIQMLVDCIESFQPIELSRENQRTVDHLVGVRDVYASMSAIPQQFKDLTNFWPQEFQELCERVCPVIQSHARISGTRHIVTGRPVKLFAEERLLNFLLYMKHDNTIFMDSQRWNWSRTSVCDDAIFVASCINEAISNEIRWPSAAERVVLAQTVPELPGCIGFVDGTLCRIRRPFEDPHHKKWRRMDMTEEILDAEDGIGGWAGDY
ncbi:unnamed protein product [Calypogeia fissa]